MIIFHRNWFISGSFCNYEDEEICCMHYETSTTEEAHERIDYQKLANSAADTFGTLSVWNLEVIFVIRGF